MANIYDDVETLKQKVALLELEVPSKIDDSAVNLTTKDLNLLIGKIIMGYGNDCVNKPEGAANGYFINLPHSTMAIDHNKQIWIERHHNRVWMRYQEASVFSDWELICGENIVTGKIMPTCRKVDGKTVYCKRINIGKLANTGAKEVSHGLKNVTIVDVKGHMHGTPDVLGAYMPLPFSHPTTANSVSLFVTNAGKVVVTTGRDRTAYSAIVDIYFTYN